METEAIKQTLTCKYGILGKKKKKKMSLRDAQTIVSMSTVQIKQFMLERKTSNISFRRKSEYLFDVRDRWIS